MAEVVLAATHEVALPPHEVYELFGARSGVSWLFDAQCDAVRTGAPVTLTLPPGSLGGERVQILGRITKAVPGRLVQIAHDHPWAGCIRVLIRPNKRGGSLVSVTGDLDQRGLDWVMRRRGWVIPDSADGTVHRVGLLTSKTGPGAVFTVASEYMAELALEEINEDGGLQGRRVELLVGDDQTNPSQAVSEARRLIDSGCRTIIAGVTSASFTAVADALATRGLPIIHPLLNEGGRGSEFVLRWGERPLNQVRAAADAVMKSAGGKRWYMIGNDYSWAHGAHYSGRRAISEAGAQVVGNHFVELGTADFSSVLERIEQSGADCVLSTLVGADEVAFERQTWDAGLRTRWETLSLVLEESARERIADAAAAGIWTAFGYFEGLDTPENATLVRRYRARYGAWAPPLSSLSESVYEACLLYAAAVRQGGGDPRSVASALRQSRARMPRGLVTSDGPHVMRQELRVARAVEGGFRVANG
jgi:branched-chain amino acid transport system substrate-binding protein